MKHNLREKENREMNLDAESLFSAVKFRDLLEVEEQLVEWKLENMNSWKKAIQDSNQKSLQRIIKSIFFWTKLPDYNQKLQA